MTDNTAQAEFLLNAIKNEMAQLARAVTMAIADGNVEFWEIVAIGRESTELGTAFMHAMRGATKEVQAEMLRVLEHGKFVGPETS